MTVEDLFQRCYDLFGKKVKVKFHHTTRGDTWEITVRANSKEEAVQIIEWINDKLKEITQTNVEVKDARKDIPTSV